MFIQWQWISCTSYYVKIWKKGTHNSYGNDSGNDADNTINTNTNIDITTNGNDDNDDDIIAITK